jgi:Tol biopolymer transport system component
MQMLRLAEVTRMKGSPRRGSTIALAVSLFALVTGLPAGVFAFHRDTPFLVPLSAYPGGDSQRPSSSRGEPKFVVFDSSSDLMGNGSAPGRQLFLFDFRIGIRVLSQITNTPGDSRSGSVDSDGEWVAFDSNADILGNGNAQRQIFLWERATTSFVQLTDNQAVASERPFVDEQGAWIVFTSGDLLQRGSVGKHVFLASLTGRCSLPASCPIRQVTFMPGQSDNPEISGDANFVFFNSDAALIGPSNGFQQIYGFDRLSGETFQITYGSGDSTNPSTDKTGRFVAFQSSADLLNQGIAGTQVYLYDRDTQLLQQITDVPGISSKPSLGRNDQFITFVSNADVLRNGSQGQHLFLYDPRSGMKFQLTDKIAGSSDNPWTSGNTIFFFDSSEDVMHTGITGRQVYAINVFGALPNSTLGSTDFLLLPGGLGGGSQAELKTRNATYNAYLGTGKINLHFGTPDVDGIVAVDAAASKVVLPPIQVPSFGAICLKATDIGLGKADCTGGLEEANQILDHDRNTDAVDPTCTLGCREGAACWEPLPVAFPGVCQAETLSFFGDFRPGGLRIDIPIAADLSVARGGDNVFCTLDDDYRVRNVAVGPLRLTTETANTTLRDADNITAASLSSSRIGAAFDCNRIRNQDLLGARLVAVFPFYNFPIGVLPTLPGPNDMLMSIMLEADKSNPCTSGSCVPENCTSDLDCDDDNVCNGIETCDTGVCRNGIPLVCDDSNFCNGPEVCDPLTGCQDGTQPDCKDNDHCTDDICDPEASHCVHIPFEPCCAIDADCDDQSICTGTEHCLSGHCVVVPDTPIDCDDNNPCTEDLCDPVTGCFHNELPNGTSCLDGNVCNGDEICLAGACTPGLPLVCDDGVVCTTNDCHPFLGCYFLVIPQCCIADSDCNDLTICNGLETCQAGTCVKGTPLTCNDGNACNGEETCDPLGGCLPGTPLVCNDGATCSIDACDPTKGCVRDFTSGCCTSDADCIDNNVCNGAETCVAGDCVEGSPLVCDDGNQCNGLEICDPAGGCVIGLQPDDFDEVICTLNAIQLNLKSAGDAALGGVSDARRLKQLIVGARQNLVLAGRGSGRFARRKINGARRRVEKFIKRIQGSEAAGIIDPGLAQSLASQAQSTIPLIVRLQVNGPVP